MATTDTGTASQVLFDGANEKNQEAVSGAVTAAVNAAVGVETGADLASSSAAGDVVAAPTDALTVREVVLVVLFAAALCFIACMALMQWH